MAELRRRLLCQFKTIGTMKKLLQISLSLAIGFVGTGLVHAQDAKEGEKKIAMCVGCHGIPGYRASFPEVYRVPMIGGQNAKYLATALSEYAKGDRKHPTMRGIAGSLSDKDVADISAYYQQQAQLPAAPDTPAPPSAWHWHRTNPSCWSTKPARTA